MDTRDLAPQTKPIAVISRTAALVLFLGAADAGHAENAVFDELRFGTSASIGSGHDHESEILPSLTVFFDPFSDTQATVWTQTMLEPRLYLGVAMGAGDSVSEVYGGVSFDVDVTEKLFLELGVGGTVHDGDLDDDGGSGPKLGCRLLFREYAAAGYRFDDRWQVLATIDHASNADLCDGPNDGLTHAGLAIGYKF